MPDAIGVTSLTKRYGAVTALDDISFRVPEGAMFAFLGTNGAGKSTTIGCLTTVTPFDVGTVRIAGVDAARDPHEVRNRIGVVFQRSLLDDALTIRENLLTRLRLYRRRSGTEAERIEEIAELVGLGDILDRRYGRLSGGQRRRADIARALLPEPAVLFLDEPTAGLDPANRAQVWAALTQLRDRRGMTVFLTTHYMEETEDADQVCVIDAGRIVAEGTPTELRAAHTRHVLTITARERSRLDEVLAAARLVAAWSGDVATVAVPDADTARAVLRDAGDDVVDFEFRHGRMDEAFLALAAHRRAGAAA